MKVKKLKIEGFKSIYDSVVIDFDYVRGFWWVRGDVGVGKTTLSEAIIFGLFGEVGGKNNTDLVSWGRKKGSVQLWCESKGHSIFIERTLKTQGQCPIYVEIDGQALNFTDKRNAQSILETEYYDISQLAAEMLCIISFNNFKSISTMSQKDTKQFLDKILGFSLLTQYVEICKELRKENSNSIIDSSSNIKSITGQIDRLTKIMNIDIIEGNIEEVENNINNIKTKIADLKSNYKLDTDPLSKQLMDYRSSLNTIKTLGTNKKKEIDFIKKGICPTCGAPIDQSQLEIKEQERQLLLNQYSNVSSQINDIDNLLSSKRKDYEQALRNLEASLNTATHLCIRLKEQEKRSSINNDEIEKLKQELEIENKELEKLRQDDREWQALIDNLLIETRGKILQVFVPVLNTNINKYASRLRLPYTIQFDENFNCNLNMYGLDQQIPIRSLSTGQLKVVDMVIILGVINTIINSHNINILFLDELFSNLDAELRNEMCSILRENLMGDNTIFITSHQEIEQRWLDGRIDISLKSFDNFEKHSVIDIIQVVRSE
jgi:DNA repair exonuclease SbcCD ATPase subunit